MISVKQAVLLLLLGAVASSEETDGCEALTKRLSAAQLDKIFGSWVTVWSVEVTPPGAELMRNVNTSHVAFSLLPDNHTVQFLENNFLLSSHCMTFTINLTAAQGSEHLKLSTGDMKLEINGFPHHFNDSAVAEFYETDQDCLLMVYTSARNTSLLMSYRREGSHRDVDQQKAAHDDLKKMAECLKFPTDNPYVYDGVSEFCHKKRTDRCEALTKRLSAAQLDKIFGSWVLVWSVADSASATDILTDTISSHVEFKLLADNQTVQFLERNIYRTNESSCVTYLVNMTVNANSEDLKMQINGTTMYIDDDAKDYDGTGEVHFYQACDDCLTIVDDEKSGQYLLTYRREGSHRDVDQQKAAHDDLKKAAECLKFPTDKPFIYDGVSEFCHKKRTNRCEALTKHLSAAQLDKIFGSWVLVWSVADSTSATSALTNTISSHVELHLLADNQTVQFLERNVYRTNESSCVTYLVNMTVNANSEDLKMQINGTTMYIDDDAKDYDGTGEVRFYQACDDCLTIVYDEKSGQYLLTYRREGSHRDVDQQKAAHDDLKKMAECLKFPTENSFIYDGVSGFCGKKSAAEAKPEEA